MYKKAAKLALISCGVFIFSIGANAVPITFNFSGGGPNAMALPFSDAGTGVSISVRGRNITDGTAALVTWNNNGLGVRSDDEIGTVGGGSGQLDSFGDNERLNFNVTDLGAFSGLELVSIEFWNIDLIPPNTDDFGVRFDGVNPFAGTGIGNNFTPGSNPWIAALDLDLADLFFTNQFSILLNGNDSVADAFRVRSITFNAVGQVPEPGSLLLVAIGLIGVGLSYRKAL